MKVLTLILSLAFLLMSATLGITGEDPDLVAYYPFDGDSEDASGNDNHGEITGGSKWVKGKFGEAIELEPAAYVEPKRIQPNLRSSHPRTKNIWIYPPLKHGF